MNDFLSGIDLSDAYTEAYSREIESYRRFVAGFVDQIFIRLFVESGRIDRESYHELTDPDNHASQTACLFTTKMLDYYLDREVLVMAEDGRLSATTSIEDPDPGDQALDRFLADNPDKRDFFGILRQIRDAADRVLGEGEDALLCLANDDFREAMRLWENLMLNARVKRPCHEMILRALARKASESRSLVVFEGGAGVGAVLRDGLKEPGFERVLDRVQTYFYTDISLSLIKMGREALRQQLPSHLFERFVFKTANLDHLELDRQPWTCENTVDIIILEHVLYDVVDLDRCLKLFHRILKPGGVLAFTMAFRTDPRGFFLFEFLQSTFQSYHKARLEPAFREHVGYLTLGEWEKSLQRAGFGPFRSFPDDVDQVRWPYGGMLAIPSK